MAERHRKRWTREDDLHLTCEWGDRDPSAIAATLGRTAQAVACRAWRLGLRVLRETQSLRQVAREGGYSAGATLAALRRIGVRPKRALSARGGRRLGRMYAIDAGQKRLAFEHLMSVPDGSVRGSVKGQWGVRGRPCACRRCQRASLPHYALGLCGSCYRHRGEPERRVRHKGPGGRR